MPQRMHYEVTATIRFEIAGPLTIGGAADMVSKRLDRIRAADHAAGPVKSVTVTDVHIHQE